MKTTITLAIIVLVLASCKKNLTDKSNMEIASNGFSSRIHTPEMETDVYKLLGTTSYEKHLKDFESVDWKKDYWNEYRSNSFNMTDLEVFSENDSRYLSISTSPDTDDTFQFYIGYGTQIETEKPRNPKRIVKMYLTESESDDVPKEFIELFFRQDFDQIESKLKDLFFMDEIEDLYININ
jgi:hypothetical protein